MIFFDSVPSTWYIAKLLQYDNQRILYPFRWGRHGLYYDLSSIPGNAFIRFWMIFLMYIFYLAVSNSSSMGFTLNEPFISKSSSSWNLALEVIDLPDRLRILFSFTLKGVGRGDTRGWMYPLFFYLLSFRRVIVFCDSLRFICFVCVVFLVDRTLCLNDAPTVFLIEEGSVVPAQVVLREHCFYRLKGSKWPGYLWCYSSSRSSCWIETLESV